MVAPMDGFARRIATAVCVLLTLAGAAQAEEPSAGDILRALTPGARASDRSIIIEPRVRRKPSTISEAPAGPPPKPIQAAPSISLTVPFAYDSAEIAPEATTILEKLAVALRDPSLAGFHFEIAGHTDARGDAGYNLDLSGRRAAAVRDYLIRFHRIAAGRLIAHGYGKSRLADPAHPEAGANRRVEIVNLGAVAAKK